MKEEIPAKKIVDRYNTFSILRKNSFLASVGHTRSRRAFDFALPSPLLLCGKGGCGEIISVRVRRRANQNRRLANACNVAQGMIRRRVVCRLVALVTPSRMAPYHTTPSYKPISVAGFPIHPGGR